MKSIAFNTKISVFGNNTGIEVPDNLIEELNKGKRPSLIVKVNDYEYQATPGIMNGKTLISFSSAHRKKSGIQGGDKVKATLKVATEPKRVELSKEFLDALNKTNTKDFFDSLSNSLQRYHCDLINSSKAEDTMNRRIQKSIELFKQGKKR